jgi:hypothetical protein
MAHTAQRATDSTVLRGAQVHFEIGSYSYNFRRENGSENYSVSDGTHSFSTPLLWAFGSDNRGQSYIFQHNNTYYVARISFFAGLGFNVTPDHPEATSGSLEEALGRPLPHDEQIKCFGCHTVASTTNGNFVPAQAMLGISCEGCHGAGAAHVALASEGGAQPGLIFNPARLSPVQSVDFCGACHRTWWDVNQESGIRTVRFPALRLEQSRCWGDGDVRITCIACHDPHQPLSHDSGAYDAKCLSCHQSKSSQHSAQGQQAPACRVSTKNCVSCHMGRYKIPAFRVVFTDHKIQILRSKNFQE